jgi:peptidoglycan/LPS O-acetylase OafA/YrhL
MKYIPGLDGMRAAAILAVMLTHAGVLPGGIYGVDVFFVLSGWLITVILLREGDKRRIDLKGFYLRRVLRLLPAVVVVVGLVFVFANLLGIADAHEVPSNALAIFTYTENFWVARTGGMSMLDHFWSLAVEEQFYLLWPAVLLLVVGRTTSRRMTYVMLGVTLLSTLWGIYLAAHHASDGRLGAMLDTRGVGLFLGCALGYAYHAGMIPTRAQFQRGLLVAAYLCVAGLLVLSRLAPRGDHTVTYFSIRGGYLGVSLATAVILTHIVTGGPSLLSKLASNRTLVWIGKLSYSLYLVHKLVYISFLQLGWPRNRWMAVSIPVSFLAAYLLNLFVERPFLRVKDRITARRRVAVDPTPTPAPAL